MNENDTIVKKRQSGLFETPMRAWLNESYVLVFLRRDQAIVPENHQNSRILGKTFADDRLGGRTWMSAISVKLGRGVGVGRYI